jgi:hypothetical protein
LIFALQVASAFPGSTGVLEARATLGELVAVAVTLWWPQPQARTSTKKHAHFIEFLIMPPL